MDSESPPQPPQSSSVPPPLPPAKKRDMLLPTGRSHWAIAAGYFGLFSLVLIGGPFALFCGIMGLRQIKKSEGGHSPLYGKGRAIFGIIAGSLGTAVIILIIWAKLNER